MPIRATTKEVQYEDGIITLTGALLQLAEEDAAKYGLTLEDWVNSAIKIMFRADAGDWRDN
jgi:hypothetical protein